MLSHELPKPDRPNTFAPIATQIDSLRALDIDIELVEISGSRKLKYVQAVAPFLRRVGDADLVHVHFGHPGLIARLQSRKPVVISFMGSDLLGKPRSDDGHVPMLGRLSARFYRRFAKTFDAVIVKSPEMAVVLRPVRAHVVPNGVDLERFRPMPRQEARSILGWDPEALYVLFPGDPANPRKGYATLALPAVQAVAERVSRSVEMPVLSGIEPEMVPYYMNACDVQLMTSYIEGSPNVVKEAMACNLPVVSVPVGDVQELLDGVEGGEICARSPQALADRLVTVLERGPARSNGRLKLQREGLDLASVAKRIRAIYQETLARQH